MKKMRIDVKIKVGRSLRDYLWNEWRYNVHKRYLKYFDEWYDNLTDAQRKFYKSWMEGYMSPWH